MNCAVHSDVEATGFCRNCGKAMCAACARDVRGALYCEPCLSGLVSAPPSPPAASGTVNHPGIALALGFIPGLGAVYNGEYMKALIHVLIFGGLIAAETQDISGGGHAFLGLLIGCFALYMPIDAYRVAKARQDRAASEPPSQEGIERRPLGATVLIGLGILLLLGNFGLLDWDWFARAWPVALIAVGGWLIWKRLGMPTERPK